MHMDLAEWPKKSGVITHSKKTRERIIRLLQGLDDRGLCKKNDALALLTAADDICNMAMWLTVHMTYARNVHLDGQAMSANDFKTIPQGHTGGALNMVPAYVGYMLANALTGNTRAWLMGQGHCVAAIDSVNVLLRNLDQEQDQAYPLTEQGLSKLCRDYYSYQHDKDGRPTAPLGSHVNPYTAGGIMEGGYLGFASLQYSHMPLPGQELVAFLSDGAFEEQRGSDWAPSWWRGEDTGLVMPIMIANGRRIEQRTSSAQKGGAKWLAKHFRLNGFDPIEIDGRDPAAFAWAILTMAIKLEHEFSEVKANRQHYPVKLPYAIAETVKGYGFPGAGTNAAHNLPLVYNPSADQRGAALFNRGASKVFVSLDRVDKAAKLLSNHTITNRQPEKDHCLRIFSTPIIQIPDAAEVPTHTQVSPMRVADHWFAQFAQLNQDQRFRVANPDELRSNRFNETLDYLQHRVTNPEQNVTDSITGSVISALNEEAVICAIFANKQGVNLAVSYEAFAVKMLGAMRQEVIFCRALKQAGRSVNWLAVPVLVSSHTWENGKNERSHQDPTLCEVWLQEMTDVAPVYFPFDSNSGVEVLRSLYQQTGRVATVVVPKGEVMTLCSQLEAKTAVKNGALIVKNCDNPAIQIITIGAYQLEAAMRAADQLDQSGVPNSVIAIIEPGRFRSARDAMEADYVHDVDTINRIIPPCEKRVVVSHTHADVISGVLRNLDTGFGKTLFMGYENQGGTLDVEGMQVANRQSESHILVQCWQLLAS